MHGKGGHESSFEGGKVISSTEQNLPAPVEESNEAKRSLSRSYGTSFSFPFLVFFHFISFFLGLETKCLTIKTLKPI